MKPLKNPACIETLIRKLRHCAVLIEDQEQARKFLRQVSYYRLSAYLIPFKRKKNIQISFDALCRIYYLDSALREWVYARVAVVELYIRTVLGQYLSLRYGPDGYLLASSHNDKHDHYGGRFPLWLIIELFSTGMLSILYVDLGLREKKYIAKCYFNTGVKQISSWLSVLTDLRRCSGYARDRFS